MTSKAIALDDLEVDPALQTRGELSQEAIDDYSELYSEGEADMPPLEVVDVEGTFYIVDGFHRLAAARQAGKVFIRCEVVSAEDMGQAVWLAAAANQKHGVRRSNSDKRRAVLMALNSGIGVEQSTRVLAEHVGVSHMTVSNIRREWEAEHRGDTVAQDSGPGVKDLHPDADTVTQEVTTADTDQADQAADQADQAADQAGDQADPDAKAAELRRLQLRQVPKAAERLVHILDQVFGAGSELAQRAREIYDDVKRAAAA